jgi:hypothetical protein
MKSKVDETKQGISDMNDRRKVSDLLDTLASFPLCSEGDAMNIVQSLLTKYIGRSHVATIDLEAASPEEFDKEMAELDVVDEKIKDNIKKFGIFQNNEINSLLDIPTIEIKENFNSCRKFPVGFSKEVISKEMLIKKYLKSNELV